MKDYFDTELIYCRKLGHHLRFNYCRQEKSGLPCTKIFDCWFMRLPVRDFIAENYTNEEISYLSEPPQSKITSLLTLIERAKNVSS